MHAMTAMLRSQPSSDPVEVWGQPGPTLPWLVVQLKPRFLASRLQSKPFRCRISAASADGSESSCRELECEAQHWGQGKDPHQSPTAPDHSSPLPAASAD